MEAGAISMRYAKALMNFALDAQKEDLIYQSAYILSESLISQPRLKQVLVSPILPVKEKRTLMITASGGEENVCPEFKRFIDLVLQERRESYLQFMMMMYLDLYRKHKHIGTATLITAVPVDQAIEDRIKETASHLLHAKMELSTAVDSSIEGGFIFDIDGYRLDASIATQLKRVKKQFIDKNRRIV
ncbi:ATP synthase subunit delta [Bacteroides coprosuis DSM 18011]|uniref:ATP synthase subunit delta n=1 Tax=Bacteroides coprosuis DSM 18011 TaxID=679937 RepID=F3ZUT0_9BACE|nr:MULTISPECIES: F0F1 ATP synthase subunit delta [Bacteroides]EGJ71390.1 ATP synthase subunit delta [Bacteroides coprosuis DSM 18011]HJD92456.1 F0F1 ATP synthase subunit delta [Bacteroides coprosuis]